MNELIDGKPLLVVFIGPRCHTNQFGWIRALQEHGHRVVFLAYSRSPSDTTAPCKVQLIKRSWTSEWEKRLKTLRWRAKISSVPEDISRDTFRPSTLWLLGFLTTHRPKCVVLRDRTRATYLMALCIRFMKEIHAVFYDQYPLFREPASLSFHRRLIKKSIEWISGSRDWSTITPIAKPQYFVESGAATSPRAESRVFAPFVVASEFPTVERSFTQNDRLRLLVVAKYRHYKNLYIIPRAIAQVDEDVRSRLELTFVGKADLPQELAMKEDLAASMSTLGRLRPASFFSNLSYEAVHRLYSTHHVSILPSLTDLAPISPLESMAAGCVPICSETVGTSGYINNGRTGLLFSPQSSIELAEIITRLVARPTLVETLGRTGQEFASKYLTPKAFLTSLEEAFAS